MNENGPSNSPLDSLFWKDEILQVMYWLQGEDLATSVAAGQLLVLLNTNLENLLHHLGRLSDQGFLQQETPALSTDPCFLLTELGKKEAAERFSKAFQGLQKAGHGECGPDCDCQWEGHDACEHHHHH